MKTTLIVSCVNQNLIPEEIPQIYSGGNNENIVHFSFCELWDEFVKTAIFYRTEDEVYHVVLDENNSVIVPWEVTKDSGTFHLGVFGVLGDILRTSSIIAINVSKGAITEGTIPSDPTPDIYQQILSRLNSMESGNLSEEAIEGAIEDYFSKNPPETGNVSDEQIEEAVENYFSENPVEDGVSPTIDLIEHAPALGSNDPGGVEIKVTNPDGTTQTEMIQNGVDGRNGTDGKSVTITDISQSMGNGTSGGYTTITFSDGSKITVYNGNHGTNGISPHIGENGNWYIGTVDTGVKAQGENGQPGTTGKDGTSVTISSVTESTEDGGNNTVTFSDGKKLTVKNGKTGANGKDGKDGKDGSDANVTVEKINSALGYTPANAEMVSYLSDEIADLPNNKTLIGNVAAEVPIVKVAEQPKIVSSIDDMTDTSKLYVMDGYIYQYRETTITVEGETVPNFDNLMDDSRTVVKKDLRYSKSGGTWKDNTGYSGIVIPYTSGQKLELRLKNYTAGNYPQMYAGNTVDNLDLEPLSAIWSGTPDSDGVLTITTTTTIARSYIYFVLANDCIDDVIITLNQPITYTKTEDSTETVIEWVDTGLAFVPADYEERIIEAEREIAELKSANHGYRALGISEVFAPSPQLPADGSEGSDFNGKRDSITAEQIYTYIDALLGKYPRYITKEVMGKDESGTHDWCRYVCCRRAYDAWQVQNYPPMYAWTNGSTTIYSVSVSPRIGDTLYTTKYIGTSKGTVSAVSNANQSRTVGGVVYTRDKTKDVAPTLVYTETGYSPHFSSNYAGSKNGIYNGSKSKLSTISGMSGGTLTGANGISYTRYPLGDRNSNFEEIPAIVIGANEHGTGGDPATPAMISARMIKDLCECRNADNPLLNLLKNEYMMVFCPVINPWGFDKSNQKYTNSNGVNIDRNFDTPGWKAEDPAGWNPGEYGGSENETQYFMNTLVASKTEIALANHSYGEGIDSTTGEAVSGGICSYMMGRNDSKYTESLLEIAEVMAANYNLVFSDNGEAKPEDWGKTRSYIAWIGAEGGALEMNSRDGFVTDPNNEAKGAQFTARVMEAAYTELLQFLYMIIDKQES